MTENAETQTAEGAEPTAPETTAPQTDEGKNALRKQLAEYGKQLKERDAIIAQFNAAEAAKAEAESLARGEFDKLLEQERKRTQDALKQVSDTVKDLVKERAEKLLVGLNPLELKGAFADMPPDIQPAGVAEWVEQFKTANAELFTPERAAGVTPGASGEPHRGTPAGDLKARLKSTDPDTKKAALAERLSLQMSGKLPVGFE